MSVSSISGSSSLSSIAFPSAQRKNPIEDAAKALGMSADDLKTELNQGKSLGDVADQKGVSRDDLATALKNGAPDRLKNSGNLDTVVDNMINQKGGPQPPKGQGHGGPPPAGSSSSGSSSGVLSGSLTDSQQSTLDALSSLLNTDSSSLMSQLQSGTSLSDLLSKSGASTNDLAGILQDGLMVDTTA